MELLAPAGDYQCLIAAIRNGCDAVYLGLNEFGARAYAKNFTFEDLKKAIEFAHLREVRIYVTMNTIIFDEELETAFKFIDELALTGVDGVIVQDLALMDYIVNKYTRLEAHASTQCGIDDANAVLFFENLGLQRVVLAREVEVKDILEIKKVCKIEIEVFIHGALCVSYSGNCLMSGLIGYRSGNRGRCVGSCRKKYNLLDEDNNVILKDTYLLSMKDLNAIDEIEDLTFIDSLKIEGRMKDETYVSNVVGSYRKVIDKKLSKKEANYNLSKTFNRTFTKGYLLSEDRLNVVNIKRPNHHGYEIGRIIQKNKNKYTIKLSDTLNQNDHIRIEEISFPVVKMFDKKGNFINSANDICYLEFSENANINDIVYKTNDVNFNKEILESMNKEFKRFAVFIYLDFKVNEKIKAQINYNNHFVTLESDIIYEKALNKPISQDDIIKAFSKLNDTPYEIGNIELNYEEGFVSLKTLNELRRNLIEKLNKKRLEFNETIKSNKPISIPNFPLNTPKIAVYANTKEQYEACLKERIETIYYDNVARRNKTIFPDKEEVLVGGYNGIHYYKDKKIISDFSLNVCNHKAVRILHENNVERVTLSYEMNKKQINELTKNYYNNYKVNPNLELIVYGRADLMFTNYCPLKSAKLCGECKKRKFYLKDEFGEFPILTHSDCSTTILNGKILNLLDNLSEINNINYYRIQLTTESYEESRKIIALLRDKINGLNIKCFNEKTDTRGHFKKEIL